MPVASAKMFENLDIGDHEDIVRNMLLSKKTGIFDQYGCMMFVLNEMNYLHKTI